jgi:hypothetical protein
VKRSVPRAPYTTVQVCQLTGLTYRQLDYWDRTGFIHPSVDPGTGSGGSVRRYSQDDLDRIVLTKKLLSFGISLQQIRTDGDPGITADRLRKAVRELLEPAGVAS